LKYSLYTNIIFCFLHCTRISVLPWWKLVCLLWTDFSIRKSRTSQCWS